MKQSNLLVTAHQSQQQTSNTHVKGDYSTNAAYRKEVENSSCLGIEQA